MGATGKLEVEREDGDDVCVHEGGMDGWAAWGLCCWSLLMLSVCGGVCCWEGEKGREEYWIRYGV